MAPTLPTTLPLFQLDVVEKVHNQTIVMVFNKAMSILYPQSIKYDNVLLYIFDAASYMILAGKCIKRARYLYEITSSHLLCARCSARVLSDPRSKPKSQQAHFIN